MLFRNLLSLLVLLAVYHQINGQQVDPNQFCFDCGSRRNSKDLYANPDNCHTYFQCFYHNETYATGILRNCQLGTFWHEEVLQCLPEGSTPCVDQCQDQAVANAGCYADTQSCSSFFICDASRSIQMCCPPNTRFNSANCQCQGDDTCTDTCQQVGPAPPTTLQPPTSNTTHCVDSFNNVLSPVAGRADQFYLFDTASGAHTLPCIEGTSFSLETCRCEGEAQQSPSGSSYTQCNLYLPFDDDTNDHSNYKFSTFPYGNYRIDHDYPAKGNGALYVSDGAWLEVPGFKTLTPGKAASYCFFYRCENPAQCNAGGIVSNFARNTGAFSVDFSEAGTQAGRSITSIRISYTKLASPLSLQVEATQIAGNSNYAQLCIIYNGTYVTVINNNQVIVEQPLNGAGEIRAGNCPLTVGASVQSGAFNGYIDEVLVCDRALNRWEVLAHYDGRISLQNAGLIPDEIKFPSYLDVAPLPAPNGKNCGHNRYWNAGENLPVSLQMIGGRDGRPDEFPFLVVIDSVDFPQCSGVVLSESWIQPGGSCCDDLRKSNLSRTTVFYGIGETGYPDNWSPWVSTLPPPKEYYFKSQVKQVIVHPKFNGFDSYRLMNYDYCLVEVANPVDFKSWKVQPICLPSSCNDTCAVGEYLLNAGVGGQQPVPFLAVDPQNWDWMAKRPKYAVFPRVADDVCLNQTLKNINTTAEMFESSFCAGYVQEGWTITPQRGDDGSPFACYKKGYFSLDGTQSWWFINGAPRFPTVVAKECAVLDWIRSYVGNV